MDTQFKQTQDTIKTIKNWWEKTKAEFYHTQPKTQNSIGHDDCLESLCNALINRYRELLRDAQIKGLPQVPGTPSTGITEKINFLNSIHHIYLNRKSIAETLWEGLSLVNGEQITRAFEEQKHKYGTKDFKNTVMLRSLTEYSKNKFKEFIKNKLNGINSKIGNNSIELLGLGFGGAAFKLKLFANLDDNNLTPIVLKFNLAKTSGADNFGNLENDFKALANLEWLHDPEIPQRLVYIDVKKIQSQEPQSTEYLVPFDLQDEVLATWVSPGTNIMDIVEEQWNRFLQEKQPTKEARLFFQKGISDDNLKRICMHHQEMCHEKINFYDMFPHNTLFDTQNYGGKQVSLFRFIDSVTKVKKDSIEEGIANARHTYPVDSLIFDLVSFLVLHEQTHPMIIPIRRAARSYFNQKLHGADEYKAYIANKEKRFQQIIRVLDTLSKEKSINLADLKAALDRLVNHFKSSNYHPGTAFYKDFSRITEEGKKYILRLKEHFYNSARSLQA
jgi:hypothetical protein